MDLNPANKIDGRIIVYEDFNCPFCYALTEIIQRNGLVETTVWRGIEHVPAAPIPWSTPGATLSALLRSEVETVRRRLPDLNIEIPGGQPNTGYAILAVADAMRIDEPRAHKLKTRIKHALWRDNRDISDKSLIDYFRSTLSFPPLVVSEELRSSVAEWYGEWSNNRPRMLPSMLTPNGVRRAGLGEPDDAIKFLRDHTQ